ncbi:MAG: hypothetical protein GY915_02955, partial [bacterium]|nr:hypothetical protein [bacterium]
FIKQKFEVAGAAQDTMFSRRWIAEHIFGLDNEEFLRNQRERYFDKKMDKSLEATAEEPAFDAPTGGGDLGTGELGGEEMGDELGGEAPLEAAETAADTPDTPEAEEGPSPLLVEPGAAKRDDGMKPVKMTFKDGSEMYVGKGKGKRYKPVPSFKDGRKSAGRKKNFLSTAGASKDIKQLG